MEEQITKNFKQHSLDADGTFKCGEIRSLCQSLAFSIDDLCPNSREKAVALTKLEEVMFWANAAIARG